MERLGARACYSPEEIDNLRRRVSEQRERFKNRLSLENPRLAQRYVKKETRLVVRFKMRANGSAIDLAAIFEGRTVGGSDVDELVGKHRVRLGAGDLFQLSPRAQPDASWPERQDDQETMFVDDVELVQGPEKFVLPSLVRLQPLELLHDRLRCSTYLSLHRGFVLFPVELGTAPDREVGLERRLLAVVPNDGVGEVVERGSEIVDRVTQDQSDRVGDARVGENPTAVARAIRIVLADDGFGFRYSEPREFMPEIDDVLVGPFELPLDAVEGIHGSALF